MYNEYIDPGKVPVIPTIDKGQSTGGQQKVRRKPVVKPLPLEQEQDEKRRQLRDMCLYLNHRIIITNKQRRTAKVKASRLIAERRAADLEAKTK